jgi:hypothetical protein
MAKPTTKAEILETLRAKHRQLERYLFHFEKNAQGVFVASGRPKFGLEEMMRSGVVDGWSLKELLAHLIDWEQRLVAWCESGQDAEERPSLASPQFRWEDVDPDEHEIPADLAEPGIGEVLRQFQLSYRTVLACVDEISAQELTAPDPDPRTGGATLADYVALCTYAHYDWAKGHIRRWRQRHAGEYLNKEVVLDRIRTERRRLERNLALLDEDRMQIAGVVNGWSIKDILAHLVEWEQRFLGWYRIGLRGVVPEVPAPGLGWDQLDVLNQRIYQENHDRPLADVMADFRASYREVLQTVRAIPEAEMFDSNRFAWTGDGNLVGYIMANTANHYRWAKRLIREWMGAQGWL